MNLSSLVLSPDEKLVWAAQYVASLRALLPYRSSKAEAADSAILEADDAVRVLRASFRKDRAEHRRPPLKTYDPVDASHPVELALRPPSYYIPSPTDLKG